MKQKIPIILGPLQETLEKCEKAVKLSAKYISLSNVMTMVLTVLGRLMICLCWTVKWLISTSVKI